MKITILAKSSKAENEPYSVDFIFKDNMMSVYCSCPAGRFGKFCKHKFGLLKGSDFWLYDDNQYDELEKINEWVQKSGYLDYIIKISKLERDIEEAQERLKETRKELAIKMKSGLK